MKALYGLVGFPLGHSLSPDMHNAAFKALDIDAEYILFQKSSEELDSFLEEIKTKNIKGFNVTVPYKQVFLDKVELGNSSFGVKQIGAVNTVVDRGGVLTGFNTDHIGFSRHLHELGIGVSGKRIALLGAGGGARAVAYALRKAKELVIFDIDCEKANSLAKIVENDLSVKVVASIDEFNLGEKDILINATPIGLKEDDSLLIKEDDLHKDLFVYDLIYNPAKTKLLKAADGVGAKYSNGLGMLLYQGVLAFEHFTGCQAPVEIMRQALEEGIKKR